MQRIIVLLFVILTLPLAAHAESRYVTDQILVALRSASDDAAPPLEYLATGMRVEVVEDLGAFLKIKSASGVIGFARSKYFIAAPPAGATAATADVQEQLTAAQQRIAELSAEVQRLKSTPTDLARTELAPQEGEKGRAETAAIIQERDQLKQEVARLKETGKKSTLPPLSNISQLQWFLAGAAILLVGWFAGKSSRSKRRF
jgi:SH3 domain protein